MSLLHSSTKRPAPLKNTDYDHKIILVDHARARPASSSPSSHTAGRLNDVLTKASSRRNSDGGPLHKSGSTLRQDWSRRKWTKYKDNASDESDEPAGGNAEHAPAGQDQSKQVATEVREPEALEDRGRTQGPALLQIIGDEDSAIDMLYENQRGWYLCGLPLFSSKALGNLDPAPWTNDAHKPSATDPTNAQVPDPSWQWAWRDWSINKEGHVDDEGWLYSFSFSKSFSWHRGQWWNSFVRRRVWIRKRVKRPHADLIVKESCVLSENYFAIHPAHGGAISTKSRTSSVEPSKNRYSVHELVQQDISDEIAKDDIRDIESLMNVLRFSRIDREKMEAVESFIEHGGSELQYLESHMHAIMRSFIFQASRRLLLTHLIEILDESSDSMENKSNTESPLRTDSLEKAIHSADQEVQKLEYWSDVRRMAESGATKGANDPSQGWDDMKWAGIDASGPRDLKKLPGQDGDAHMDSGPPLIHKSRKGKGKDN